MAVVSNPNGLKTQPSTTFGTRQLLFLQVDMNTDVATGYLNSDSLYSQAIRAMQTVCEVYGVGLPNGEYFTALAAFDTAPMNDGQSAGDGDRITEIETAIDDATGSSCHVWNGRLQGDYIWNDC
jgi:hypothetical protein